MKPIPARSATTRFIGFDVQSGATPAAMKTANAKGTTVGFTSGDTGYLVAVRTGKDGDPKKDLPLATGVADQIAQGS